MQISLKNSEKMLLALLCSAINSSPAEATIFISATTSDWEACYHLAKVQGVMALAWDGIVTLPCNLLPPHQVKLKWALIVENYESRYIHYCQTAQYLSDFYASHGIKTLFLKGVGFSAYYPKPQHREGGDIDIYTYSASQNRMSDTAANALADQLMIEQGIEVKQEKDKHSTFYYHHIPIENHKTFLDIREWKIAIPLEKELECRINPQRTSLLKGNVQILTPSNDFNTLFIAFHAMRHYGDGLCLHHMCDWACLLKHQGLTIPHTITEKKFLAVIYTFTAFTNLFFHTNCKVDYDESKVRKLIQELFNPDPRNFKKSPNHFIAYYKRIVHFFRYRKLIKQIAGESIMRGIWQSIKLRMH